MGGPTAGPDYAPYKIPVSWGVPEETLEITILKRDFLVVSSSARLETSQKPLLHLRP